MRKTAAVLLVFFLSLACVAGASAASTPQYGYRYVPATITTINQNGTVTRTQQVNLISIQYKYYVITDDAGHYTGAKLVTGSADFPKLQKTSDHTKSFGKSANPDNCSFSVSDNGSKITVHISGGGYSVTYKSAYMEKNGVTTVNATNTLNRSFSYSNTH